MEYNNLEEFNWHDCPLYSIKFDENIIFDIDYILKWELQPDSSFKYLIAPARLTFYEVSHFEISVNTDFVNGFEIHSIVRNFDYLIIELQEGFIKMKSKGFTQELTKEPIWKENQCLTEEERAF